jgi:hypothetical protein
MENKVVTPKKEESKSSSKEQSNDSSKKNQSNGSSSENLKGIENHKQAAKHHQDAAKNHLDAAKFHEAGDHEQAAKSTVKAQGSASLANEASREDAKNHATINS